VLYPSDTFLLLKELSRGVHDFEGGPPQLRAQYEHLKIRGPNKARVAIARKLLTIAFQILRDQRPYQRRSEMSEEGASSTISRLS
jgi:transposase